ncbi:g3211 [Coccomyxa viridis]|uniref:G3211 protein n=1 Tax=Coccomyxa viridis TaxID=1274662 RepID=A0ABP1FPJ5_9CHLO
MRAKRCSFTDRGPQLTSPCGRYRQMKLLSRLRITAVMAIAFTAEHADSMILSAMYLAIARSLGISMTQVGTLSTWRAIVQAILVPFVGILGNLYNRVFMISAGTILWGAMASGMGFANNYAEAAAWCALNGLGLAMVIPCIQSILAEVWVAKHRGRAFGSLFTISALGGIGMKYAAIVLGTEEVGRFDGWRVIFFAMAGVAALATVAVFFGGIEPRNLRPKEVVEQPGQRLGPLQALRAGSMIILKSTWTVFRIRSFQVILAAGIVGGLIGGMMGYKIMWLQLLGFSGWAVGLITTCTVVGAAVGFIIGGCLGDMLHARYPNAARPFANQLSMVLSTPLAIMLYKGMPGAAHATGVPGSMDRFLPSYCAVCFGIGTLTSWPASNNAALFAEIVPEAVRTSVYAFDKSIVMALGAISTPLSGLLAEKVFGATTLSVHKPSQRGGGHAHAPAPAVAKEHANNLTNAHALENGLLTTLLIPLVLKFIIYTFLYWTLPRDRIQELEEDADVPSDEEAGNAKAPRGLPPSKPRQGSRPGSLGSMGKASSLSAQTSLKTKYSGVPGINRDALRAGLAMHVLDTAKGGSSGSAEANGAHHGQQRQSLKGTSSRHSLRAASLETVQRYLTLEVASSYPATATPDVIHRSTQ